MSAKIGLVLGLLVLVLWPAAAPADGPIARVAASCADYPNQAAAQRAADTRPVCQRRVDGLVDGRLVVEARSSTGSRLRTRVRADACTDHRGFTTTPASAGTADEPHRTDGR
jgi:hypothetical protein